MMFIFLIISLITFLFPSMDENQSSYAYFGEWPINNSKDMIKGPELNFKCPKNIGCECSNNSECINGNCLRSPKGSYCYPKEGDIFPHFISIDQFEDLVDIYDFANQGKYILIEMGAVWCSPCNLLANWFSYGNTEITNKSFWKPEYDKIYDLVNDGDIYFITIIYEDENRDNASYDTIYEWYDNYPHEKIPLFIDENKLLHKWIKPSGIPAVTLLDENMKIVNFASRGLNTSFDRLLEILDE